MSDMNLPPEFEEKIRRAMNVPDANPAFVNKLRNELVRGPVKMKSQFMFRPAWAMAFVALAVVVVMTIVMISFPGVAAAIGRLFGYVPGVGLVENTGNLRMLPEPVSLTRDGVTLTISSVFVYPDRVELSYDVTGIVPENDSNKAADATTNPTAFCGGTEVGEIANTDGDARLLLPDGTVLERDQTGKYPQNVFAMKPVYAATVPASVTKMTLVLDCIPWARRGVVPEGWSVPFELESIPAGTLVGAPVIEIQPTVFVPTEKPTVQASASTESLLTRPVSMTLKRVVPLDSSTVVYFSLDMENKDPSLVSIMPLTVYAIDSQGQKTQMRGNFTWQPFEHRAGSEFEFVTQSKPPAGPLTIVVEKAVAYYAPLHVESPQARPADMEFIFDAGENPQPGQSWSLDRTINIAGYPIRVTSARVTTYEEVAAQNPPPPGYFDSQGHQYFESQGFLYGYDFTLETDPSVKMLVEMDIMSETPVCGLSNPTSIEPQSSSIHYAKLCRDEYPKGNVKVQIWQLAVLLENTWQSTWNP